MKIEDFIINLDQIPIINKDSILKEALDEMEKFNLVLFWLLTQTTHFKGVITDGDIRRLILKEQKPMSLFYRRYKQACKFFQKQLM